MCVKLITISIPLGAIKSHYYLKKKLPNTISIPLGAIKSKKFCKKSQAATISIPLGAIKSFDSEGELVKMANFNSIRCD